MGHASLHCRLARRDSTGFLKRSVQDWACSSGMDCVGCGDQYGSAGILEQRPIVGGTLFELGGCVGFLGPMGYLAGATLGLGGPRLGCGCMAVADTRNGAWSVGVGSC